MDPAWLQNLGYAINLLALTVRDVLWLRTVLLPAQLSFLVWGSMQGFVSTVAWNVLFIGINLFQIVRILMERRPIDLPPDLDDIYERFSEMTRREFLLFWEMGTIRHVRDVRFIQEGERPRELMLITEGEVEVKKGERSVAKLNRGSFVAELSFLTQEPASACVHALGEVEYNSWNQQKLNRMRKINPDLFLKIQRILGRDVTDKIRMASQREETAGATSGA